MKVIKIITIKNNIVHNENRYNINYKEIMIITTKNNNYHISNSNKIILIIAITIQKIMIMII